MIKFRHIVFIAVALLCATTLLHAQFDGCEDSPEAPTDILMLVGSIGMFYGSSVVMKMFRRGRKG
jgi:XrtJ-associated TM-motif-TM protein